MVSFLWRQEKGGRYLVTKASYGKLIRRQEEECLLSKRKKEGGRHHGYSRRGWSGVHDVVKEKKIQKHKEKEEPTLQSNVR